MRPATKSSLSRPRIRLLEWMQRLEFGTIEHLIVRNGEPLLDPLPSAVRDVKFGAENCPRPELKLEDFALKVQVLDLCAQLDSIGNGTIRCLVVKNGLPFRMQIEEVTA